MRDFQLHPRLRIAALTIAAFTTGVRGSAYIGGDSSAQISFIDGLIPPTVWAVIWFTAAVAMVAGIWHRDLARIALAAGVTLWGLWTVSYTLAWVTSETSARSWLTASTMVGVAGLMWIVSALMDSIGPPPAPPNHKPLPVEE